MNAVAVEKTVELSETSGQHDIIVIGECQCQIHGIYQVDV